VAKTDEFVVDASVVTKWFLDEPDSSVAIRLRDDFATGRIKLTVPSLMFYEVVNALRFSGEFGEEDLAVAARSLNRYKFGTWMPLGKLLEHSARLSLRDDLTVYDACYVALAKRIQSKVITGDRELLGKFPEHTLPLNSYQVRPVG
jgi:predicted nucleic acid-binding protein